LLQLSLIKDVGNITIQNLLEKVGADGLENLHQFILSDFLKLGLSQARAKQLVAGLADDTNLKKELALITKYQVSWITLADEGYPALLRHIQGSPPVLYWKGSLAALQDRALAIVGSRQANQYGQSVINEIVPQMVQAGYTIVSGGALGIDAMAHQAALKAGGTTIVVCGTGLKYVYPAQHATMFAEIIANGGAVVSSFAMDTVGMPNNFPARNRIISGLSQGCLVVQAAAQSGAKITAQFALEQGREVFVIPGLFGDPLSAGCHNLAQQGAKLVHNIEDILSELVPSYRPLVQNINKTTSNSADLLVNLCSSPISFDALLATVELESNALQERLFELQLDGILKQNFAGLWEKC